MVSNAREDLPLPLKPVTTTNSFLGIETSAPFRLWALAPVTVIYFFSNLIQFSFNDIAKSPYRSTAGPHRESQAPHSMHTGIPGQVTLFSAGALKLSYFFGLAIFFLKFSDGAEIRSCLLSHPCHSECPNPVRKYNSPRDSGRNLRLAGKKALPVRRTK